MVINILNGKDVITLDFRLNQIRYCKDVAKHGEIKYFNQSHGIMEAYQYLYDNNRTSFMESLAEDIGNDAWVHINPEALKVISDQEYTELFTKGK
jgi:NADPH-dependent 7-cyano-7-deazaguanine reductase QueF